GVSWAVFRAVPTRDSAGQLTGALVTFIDITERKRAEEDLQKSEARWRLLAESLPDFVVMTDLEARIESINRTLPEYELASVMGSPAYAYIAADYVDDWKKTFQSVLETKKAARFDTRGAGTGGVTVWYEQVFVPILSGDRVERMMLVARDVTERRTIVA